MNRESVDWRGYIPAVTTPFTAGLELDRDGWRAQLDWLLAERMHGIAVAGTTGEWFSLTATERIELFRSAAGHVAGRMTVLAGCNAYTPGEVIGYARAALEAGCDGILLTPPPYIVPSRAEVVAWYRAVSDAVPRSRSASTTGRAAQASTSTRRRCASSPRSSTWWREELDRRPALFVTG